MAFEMDADRNVNGVFTMAIGVACGTFLLTAIPDIYKHILNNIDGKVDTYSMIKIQLNYAFAMVKLGLLSLNPPA